IYPPKAGTDGIDALGNKISAESGQPYKPSFDKTLLIEQSADPAHDFQIVSAQEDGYIFDDGGKLGVRTELFVRDNVDFRYGNIDFIGSVKVSGDVMPGFNITARKGIEVLGSIRGGSLICMEGDIKVKGFVY